MKKNIIFGAVTLMFIGTLLSNLGDTEAKKLAASDKYKVIRVDGRIVFQRSNADMKKGDIFLSGTEIAFKSAESRAAVISSVKGRFVLSASEKGQTKILPAANNISSRAAGLNNLMDVEKHFKGDYLVINELKLEMGTTAFPLDEDHFFYLSFMHNGDKIRKKIPFTDKNEIVLNQTEIFKVDGEAIPVEKLQMTLFYREGNDSREVSVFKPVFPNLDELKGEVKIIMDEFDNKSSEIQIQEITAYLSEFYGQPQKENLGIWLNQEFGLK